MCTAEYRAHSYDTISAKNVSIATWYHGVHTGANWDNYFVLFVKYY
jgi:hypothetical protein